ncbi:MAG: signal peptidase I [Clostridia bacterium]|nr:signal peptidase I [Clostridia bacterium]MBR4459787.1 signal peptidase I [Clostridia bacterium]
MQDEVKNEAQPAPDAEKKGLFGKKKQKKEKPKRTVGQEIVSWILTILGALAIAFAVRTFLAEPVRVDGESMDDTLANKEIMLVGKTSFGSRWLCFPWQSDEEKENAPKFTYFGDPSLLDVAICRYPHRGDWNFVKRVVGRPGDTVELKDGYLYVSGEKYDEPYINDSYRGPGSISGETFAQVYVPKKGDTVTLSGGVFTLNGEAYNSGYTMLRIAGEGGEYKIRKAYTGDDSIWVEAKGDLFLLHEGAWYKCTQDAEGRIRYRYPNEKEKWYSMAASDSPLADGDYTVQADYYFMMGDHRNASNDSRSVGAIERSYLIGTVRQVIWPLGSWRPIVNGKNVQATDAAETK